MAFSQAKQESDYTLRIRTSLGVFCVKHKSFASRSQIRSIRGSALISVLVAAGIVGFLSLVIASMVSNAFKSIQSSNQNIDFQMLRKDIGELLSRSGCTGAFRNSSDAVAVFTGSTDTLQKIVNPTTNVLIAEQGAAISPGLIVSDLRIQYQKDVDGNNVAPVADSPAAGLTTHWVELVINAERASGSLGPKILTNTTQPYTLGLITNGANEIVDCAGGDPAPPDPPPPVEPPPPPPPPGVPTASVVTVSGAGSATASCPAGSIRTGCSGGVFVGDTDSKYHGVQPSGAQGCRAVARRASFTARAYAYCLTFP